MELSRSVAGADPDPQLKKFLEKSKQAWLGMMKDKELVTFDQREERAVAESRLLAQLLLEEQLARDPAARPGAHDQQACCPKCGKPGEPVAGEKEPPQERAVVTRVGTVRFAREPWKCTTCRVVFFPLGSASGTGHRGV